MSKAFLWAMTVLFSSYWVASALIMHELEWWAFAIAVAGGLGLLFQPIKEEFDEKRKPKPEKYRLS
jgi:hypothetical protein